VLTIRVEFRKVFDSGSLSVLPTNIRLGWKSMQLASTLAYYDTAKITAVKKFYSSGPSTIIIFTPVNYSASE